MESQVGAIQSARVSAEERISEPSIMTLRPQASETELTKSMATAMTTAVTDTARELCAGDTPNSATKSGSTGCGQ